MREEQRGDSNPGRLFDGLSRFPAAARRRQFFADLSAADQALLLQLEAEPVTAYRQQLDEVSSEQKLAAKILRSDAFMRVMVQMAPHVLDAPQTGLVFTYEAVIATQLITEA